MRRLGLVRGVVELDEAAMPWPDQDGRHERRDAAAHVHDAGAGEVDDADLEEATGVDVATPGRRPAVAGPAPVRDDRVDEAGQHRRDDDEGQEVDTLGDRA